MSRVIGTAGHIDHGKTALVRALTGVDTDRLPEERRRGITIDLGFASLPLRDGSYASVVDVPGHEGFIRNMVAGATGVDMGLLVVAADEGVMPQTREHLRILELLGVPDLVVAIAKCDLADDEWLELVRADVTQLLRDGPYRGAPLVPVSAVSGHGLDPLRDAIDQRCARAVDRIASDHFRLPIDRVFHLHGTGTVVTGTVWSGRVESDASLMLLPDATPARVRGIQIHGTPATGARAGERAALAIARDKAELARGMTLVDGPHWSAASALTVRLRLLPEAPRPLRRSVRVRLHLATAEVMARVLPLDASQLAPGETGWAQLHLESPVTARAGDHFVLRSYSPIRTIGGGEVAEIDAARRKRGGRAALQHLDRILGGDPTAALVARLAESAWLGESVATLGLRVPGACTATRAAGHALCAAGEAYQAADRLFARQIWQQAVQRIETAVRDGHRDHPLRAGLPLEEARRLLPPPAGHALADAVLTSLADGGVLQIDHAVVAIPGFRPALDTDTSRLRAQILASLGAEGLAAPPVPELPAELRDHPALWPLLRWMEKEGDLVALSPTHYVVSARLRDGVSHLAEQLAGKTGLRPADFRSVLGLSRKRLLPLLEYLDRTGVTVRDGDERRLASPLPPSRLSPRSRRSGRS